jgi:uncharacterized protein YbjQ (UPF0145 family)
LIRDGALSLHLEFAPNSPKIRGKSSGNCRSFTSAAHIARVPRRNPWNRPGPNSGTAGNGDGREPAVEKPGASTNSGRSRMIVTTTDGVAGRMIDETIGVVRGTALWTRRVVKNSMGGIRQFQVTGYQALDEGLRQGKDEASKAMIAQAAALGADAIVGMRLDVIEMSNGVFCVNAAGTAVKTLKLPVAVPAFSPAPEGEMESAAWIFAARASCEGSALRH